MKRRYRPIKCRDCGRQLLSGGMTFHPKQGRLICRKCFFAAKNARTPPLYDTPHRKYLCVKGLIKNERACSAFDV